MRSQSAKQATFSSIWTMDGEPEEASQCGNNYGPMSRNVDPATFIGSIAKFRAHSHAQCCGDIVEDVHFRIVIIFPTTAVPMTVTATTPYYSSSLADPRLLTTTSSTTLKPKTTTTSADVTATSNAEPASTHSFSHQRPRRTMDLSSPRRYQAAKVLFCRH